MVVVPVSLFRVGFFTSFAVSCVGIVENIWVFKTVDWYSSNRELGFLLA